MADHKYTDASATCTKCGENKRRALFPAQGKRCKRCISRAVSRRRKEQRSMPENCGVYSITHKPSGRVYIGSSTCVPHRLDFHKSQLRRGIHPSKSMQDAFASSGEEEFLFQMLLCCAPEYLLHFEQLFIDTQKSEFNTLRFAGSGVGLVHTPEARKKIAASKIGKARPADVREKISEKLIGRKCDPDVVRRRAEKLKGRKRPQSVMDKCMASVRGVAKSEEHRAKLASANEKFSAEEVRDMRSMHASGYFYREIGEKYGINQTTVGRIVKRERYKWVN